MKKAFIGLAVLFIIGGIVMMVIGGVGFDGFGDFGEFEEPNASVFIYEEFESVDIDVKCNKVVIEKGVENEVRYNDSVNNGIAYQVKDGVLKIRNELESIGFYNKGFILRIILNDVEYDRIIVETINAPIALNNVNVKNLIELNTTNGNISMEEVKATTIKSACMNAAFEFKNIIADSLNARSTNGGVDIQNSNINHYSSNTTNGEINISDCVFNDDSTFTTSNGRVTIYNTGFKNVAIKSSNSSADISGVKADTFRLSTSNDSIKAVDIKANGVALLTGNGKIIAQKVEAIKIIAKTSNAKINLQVKGDANKYHHIEYTDNIDAIGDYVIATCTSNNNSVVISYL